MNIQAINLKNVQKLHDAYSTQHVQHADQTSKIDFGDLLNKAITGINDAQRISTEYDEKLIAGNIDNLHEPLIAAKKSEILFSFGLEVRAQILDAYREIMRIQL